MLPGGCRDLLVVFAGFGRRFDCGVNEGAGSAESTAIMGIGK